MAYYLVTFTALSVVGSALKLEKTELGSWVAFGLTLGAFYCATKLGAF